MLTARPSYLRRCLRLSLYNKISEQGFQLLGATPRTGHIVVFLCDLCHLYERKFHQKSLVRALAVFHIAAVHNLQRLVEELCGALCRLFLIALALLLAGFEQRKCLWVFRHQHVAHVRSQAVHEVACIEPLVDDVVQEHHYFGYLVFNR